MILGMVVVISNIKVVIISSDYSIANIAFILGSMIL
jgi:rRNA maturation endonuclease Nob1